MATFQPILNQSSVSPFISPGVEDNSLSGLVKDAGKIGVEAYTGYQMADLQKEIGAQAEEYFKTNAVGYIPEEAKSIGTEVGGMVEGLNAYWDKVSAEKGTWEDASEMEKSLASKLSTYQQAVAQGRMSLDQLQTRILSATREAVNRNPFLQRELLATADKYMELSGLGSYIKQQEKLQADQAKVQQKFLEDLDAEGREKDIPGWFNMSVEQKMKAIDLVRRQEYTVKEAERVTKSGAFVDEQTFREWRDTGKLDDYHAGNFNRLNVQLQTIFRDNPTAGYSANQYAIRTAIQQAKEAYKADIPSSIRDRTEVKQQIADFATALDKMEQDLSKLGSGEDMAKAVSHRVSILKDLQNEELRKKVNPEHFDMLAKLKMADPSGSILGEGNLKAINDYLAGVFNNLFKTPAVVSQLPTVTAPNKTSANVLKAAEQVGVKEKDWAPFKTIVKSYNEGIVSITDPKQRSLFLAQNLQEIARMDLTGLDSEGVLSVQKMISGYMDDPAFGLQSLFLNASNKEVTMDILEDGRLVFSGKDGDAFNAVYGSRINNALEAYAKANGLSTSAISGRFYQEYFSKYQMAEPLLEDKDLKTWEARTPEEAFKLFDEGTIDEPTYRTIVRDMLGKQRQPTPAGPTTPTPSPEARERLSAPQAVPKPAGISPEFAKELRNPKPKQQVDVKEESRKKLLDTIRVALDSTGYKPSPLLKKSSKEDAIESVSYIEALHDIPGAGPVIEGALVAFGMVNLIPTLAKKLPKMFPSMKVVPTTSNVSVAGGSSGASKAIAQGALNEAKKEELQKMKDLYQQYWKKEWMKHHVELPKTDLEWSNAIAEAQRWVMMKTKTSTIKSLEK